MPVPLLIHEHVDALALALAVSDLGSGRVLIAPALAGLSYFIHKTAYGQILVQDPNRGRGDQFIEIQAYYRDSGQDGASDG